MNRKLQSRQHKLRQSLFELIAFIEQPITQEPSVIWENTGVRKATNVLIQIQELSAVIEEEKTNDAI